MVESSVGLIVSVLVASLLGSPHCAAMCGGFTTVASGTSPKPYARVSFYHLGRLATYLVAAWGASQLSMTIPPLLFGGAMVAVGVLLLFNVRIVPPKIHEVMARSYRKILSNVSSKSRLFPFVVGAASTLLPCGWLYVYIGIAASSLTPTLTMVAFWVGTLPILTVWATASGWMLSRAGGLVPHVRAILLVLAGSYSILQHVPMESNGAPKQQLQCHHYR